MNIVSDQPNYVLLDNHKISLGRHIVLEQNLPHIMPFPTNIVVNGESLEVIKAQGFLFKKDALVDLLDVSSRTEGIAVYNEVMAENNKKYEYLYYLKGYGQESFVTLKSAKELHESLTKTNNLVSFLGKLPIPIIITESPFKITWGAFEHYYFRMNEYDYFEMDKFPNYLTLEEFKSTFKKSPIIVKKNVVLGSKIFLKIKHIPRKDIPKEYELVYNVLDGNLEHNRKILKTLYKNVAEGDFIYVQNIRTKYSDQEGLNWSFKIGKSSIDTDREWLKHNQIEVNKFMTELDDLNSL